MRLRHGIHGRRPQVFKELGIARVFEFVCFLVKLHQLGGGFQHEERRLRFFFLEKRGSELLHLFVHSFG